jgi:hypothetical protein
VIFLVLIYWKELNKMAQGDLDGKSGFEQKKV